MPARVHETFYIGIDVGGTKLNIVLIDPKDLKILRSKKILISDSLTSLSDSIVSSIVEICPIEQIASIGIGLPGMVDENNTMCFSPHIAALNGHNLAKELTRYFNCPIRVENDANCALIAEAITGEAQNKSNVLMVTLGTGIGGSLIIDGKFLKGHKGFIGEIGHMAVVKGGNSCICGKTGCWETYAASSTLSLYFKIFKNSPHLRTDDILRFDDFLSASDVNNDISITSSEEVMNLYKKQNSHATKAMNSMMEWVAFGLSSLNAVVAPEAIIIGGGIVSDFMFYEHLVDRYFKGFSQNNQFAPSIVAAANGANAGAVGAALLTVYKDNL